MRRGFWLAAGAVLGISGYRRAARLARTLTGQDRLVLARPDRTLLARRDTPALTAVDDAAAAGKTAGRKRRDAGAVAARSSAVAVRSSAVAARSAIAGAASTAGFVRDVRAGMAEYWDLRRRDSDRTLGDQSARVLPGESQQGRREP